MAELTKEYFDQVISGLATKVDLENQTNNLKAHAEHLQSELAGMIERSVNVSERVKRLESDVKMIKQALHLQ
jgi:hypothetical protein